MKYPKNIKSSVLDAKQIVLSHGALASVWSLRTTCKKLSTQWTKGNTAAKWKQTTQFYYRARTSCIFEFLSGDIPISTSISVVQMGTKYTKHNTYNI